MNFIKNIAQNSLNFIKNNILILMIIFIILSGSFIAIREFFYFGTLTIQTNEENTKIIINGDPKNLEDENFLICHQNKCAIKLFPKTHTIFIQKEGFTTEVKNIEVHLRKNTEIFVELKPNITKISEIIFKQSSGINFPIDTSKISEKVNNFSINKTTNFKNKDNKAYLFFKKTPLFSVSDNNPVFISTDEVGRNIFIVSEEKIVKFNNENKTTELDFQTEENDKILDFYPQNDGSYLFTHDNGHLISLKSEKSQNTNPIELNNTVLTDLHHLCKTPNNALILVAHNPKSEKQYETSIFINKAKTFSLQNIEEKTVLAHVYSSEISHIECINDNKINIFMNDKSAYSVEF